MVAAVAVAAAVAAAVVAAAVAVAVAAVVAVAVVAAAERVFRLKFAPTVQFSFIVTVHVGPGLGAGRRSSR